MLLILRGTSILGEVQNVEIPGPTQQLLCSKSHKCPTEILYRPKVSAETIGIGIGAEIFFSETEFFFFFFKIQIFPCIFFLGEYKFLRN